MLNADSEQGVHVSERSDEGPQARAGSAKVTDRIALELAHLHQEEIGGPGRGSYLERR